MALKPLNDNVIIKPLSDEEVTKSGIIIPDTAQKERPERGEVVAVGPGKLMDNGQRSAIDLAPGNKVVFKKYSPDEIKIENEKFLIVSASDVVAIIE